MMALFQIDDLPVPQTMLPTKANDNFNDNNHMFVLKTLGREFFIFSKV